jgi:hypothetical protein
LTSSRLLSKTSPALRAPSPKEREKRNGVLEKGIERASILLELLEYSSVFVILLNPLFFFPSPLERVSEGRERS